MKLYATVTSERATKGQGGNDYIESVYTIEHDNGKREEFCTLRLNRVGDEYMLHFKDGDRAISPNPIHRVTIEKKGEKQKGKEWDGKQLDACWCGSRMVHTHE